MNTKFKPITLAALALLPIAAEAHPGHPESDHFIGGIILLAAGFYALKHIAGSATKRVRIRKR